jgi:GDPmannose 4,6-dehydratase
MKAREKTALIFGISGQDGAYLSQFLLRHGYRVHGSSRDREINSFRNLRFLGIEDQVTLHSAGIHDFRSVVQIINDLRPSEIYNLAGQSSVGLSFSQPVETLDSILHGTINILESVRFLRLETRFYNACSGECFGNTDLPADENTPFRPRSPYGVGKAAAFWAVANYREAYNLFACSGILFNHESPMRPRRFVTSKIVGGVAEIVSGKRQKLRLGSLTIARDWGWAPEYVDAMWRMTNRDSPDDFIIATGEMHTLEEFVGTAFKLAGRDWREHVEMDETLLRPADIAYSVGNPAKATRLLCWRARIKMEEVVSRLFSAEMDAIRAGERLA